MAVFRTFMVIDGLVCLRLDPLAHIDLPFRSHFSVDFSANGPHALSCLQLSRAYAQTCVLRVPARLQGGNHVFVRHVCFSF